MRIDIKNNSIIAGRLLKDPDYKVVGNNIAKADLFVSYGKNDDEKTNVTAWRGLADIAKMLKKGDNIAVMGVVSQREYNGKTYTNVDAHWVSLSGAASNSGSVELVSAADDTPLPWE